MASRPFDTEFDFDSPPVWVPLEQIALLSRQSSRLPAFHPGEFMYMVRVTSKRQRVSIHLYKHCDTRCYLNLDDAGHAYEYRGSSPRASDSFRSGGLYRRHHSLEDAVAGLNLDAFEPPGRLWRSFPPAEWPADQSAI